jgi:hypothetical protein
MLKYTPGARAVLAARRANLILFEARRRRRKFFVLRRAPVARRVPQLYLSTVGGPLFLDCAGAGFRAPDLLGCLSGGRREIRRARRAERILWKTCGSTIFFAGLLAHLFVSFLLGLLLSYGCSSFSLVSMCIMDVCSHVLCLLCVY